MLFFTLALQVGAFKSVLKSSTFVKRPIQMSFGANELSNMLTSQIVQNTLPIAEIDNVSPTNTILGLLLVTGLVVAAVSTLMRHLLLLSLS